jgi:hypothetical protein
MIYNVAVKDDGVIQAKPFIPYQYVKYICDNQFDQMAQVDKDKFLNEAIKMLG